MASTKFIAFIAHPGVSCIRVNISQTEYCKNLKVNTFEKSNQGYRPVCESQLPAKSAHK